MIYYVTAKDVETAKQVTEALQEKDLIDCYISPLTAISCLGNKDISRDAKTALRLDLLTVCDALIVKGVLTEEMRDEIRLASLIKMEVIYYDG